MNHCLICYGDDFSDAEMVRPKPMDRSTDLCSTCAGTDQGQMVIRHASESIAARDARLRPDTIRPVSDPGGMGSLLAQWGAHAENDQVTAPASGSPGDGGACRGIL
jgi:hypothetical protein